MLKLRIKMISKEAISFEWIRSNCCFINYDKDKLNFNEICKY